MFKLRWNILRIFWRYAANYLDYNDLDPGLIQVQLKYLQIYFWWFLQWEDKVSLCCWVVIENGNLTKQNSEIFKFYKRENAKYNPSSLSLSALKSNQHPSSNRDIQHLYFLKKRYFDIILLIKYTYFCIFKFSIAWRWSSDCTSCVQILKRNTLNLSIIEFQESHHITLLIQPQPGLMLHHTLWKVFFEEKNFKKVFAKEKDNLEHCWN